MHQTPETSAQSVHQLAEGRFLRLGDVMASVGLGRTMIDALMNRPEDPFSTPIKIGCTWPWLEPEARAWKGRRIADRRVN